MNWLTCKCVFSWCCYNYKYSKVFRRYPKQLPSYLKNQPHILVLTCLNRLNAEKNVDQTVISWKWRMYKLEEGDFQPLAILTMLHASKFLLPVQTLYHWSFQSGLLTHLLRCMSFLPIFNLTFIQRKKRMFCCWIFIIWVIKC